MFYLKSRGDDMQEALLTLQIESMGQQLKVLKSEITKLKNRRSFSKLFGSFKGKMNLTLQEIKNHEYSLKDSL
jgi:hypothetical protein